MDLYRASMGLQSKKISSYERSAWYSCLFCTSPSIFSGSSPGRLMVVLNAIYWVLLIPGVENRSDEIEGEMDFVQNELGKETRQIVNFVSQRNCIICHIRAAQCWHAERLLWYWLYLRTSVVAWLVVKGINTLFTDDWSTLAMTDYSMQYNRIDIKC